MLRLFGSLKLAKVYSYNRFNFMTTFQNTQQNEPNITKKILNETLLQEQLPTSKIPLPISKTQEQTKQKVGKNSMILQVLTATMTASMLSLPQTVSRLGVFPYMISVCLSSLLSYAAFYLIISVLAEKKSETYGEMVGDILGENMRKLSKIILTFKNWTQTIFVQIMFIKFAVQILHDSFGLPLYQDRSLEIYSSQGQAFCAIVGVFMVLINIRFFMMTSLGDLLQTIGRLSLIGLLFCLLIVICTCFSGFQRPYSDQNLVYKSVFKMQGDLVSNWKPMSWSYFKTFCQGTSLIFFVLLFLHMYFPLFRNMDRPTKDRVEHVIRWTHINYTFIFIIFGVLSYLLLVQHSDVLPIPSLVIGAIPTMSMTIAKVFLTLSLLVKLPIPVFTTKDAIYDITGIQRSHENLIKLNIVICASTIALAISFQKITTYFSMFGGTLGIAIAAIFPLLCAKSILNFTPFEKGLVCFTIVMSSICLFGSITQLTSH